MSKHKIIYSNDEIVNIKSNYWGDKEFTSLDYAYNALDDYDAYFLYEKNGHIYAVLGNCEFRFIRPVKVKEVSRS